MTNQENQILELEVGMGATLSAGSDSYPYTVVAITGKKGNRSIKLTRDNYKADENHDFTYGGRQSYQYEENPEGQIEWVQEKNRVHSNTYRTSVVNKVTGRLNKYDYGAMHFGKRRYYRDPSF